MMPGYKVTKVAVTETHFGQRDKENAEFRIATIKSRPAQIPPGFERYTDATPNGAGSASG